MNLHFRNRLMKKASSDGLWIFMVFPLSQALLVLYLFFLLIEHRLGAHMLAAISFLGAACVPVDVILLRALRQLSQRRLSRERARMLSEQLERQKLHYADLSRDMEAAREIRGGIAAELRKAYAFLEERKDEEARRRLDGALETVAGHSRRFCDHPVVDALMADKSRLCGELGIRLTYALDIPESLTISGMELCAVFANVLENAVSACGSCEPGGRFIDLKAHTAGGFFIFRALNSACPARQARRSGSRLSEHGWGLSILREIAARHAGELKTERSQDAFQTVMWLKV